MTVRSIAHADHGVEARYLSSVFVREHALDEAPVLLSDLASPTHQAILGAMMAIRARSEPITCSAVCIELDRAGKRNLRERVVELSSTLELDPVSHARRIRELAEQRRIVTMATHAIARAGEGDVAAARMALAEVAQGIDPDEDRILTFRQMLAEAAEALASQNRGDRYRALGTPSIDKVFRAGPGDLVIVGAATNVGKSTMVMTWAVDMARRASPVGIISIEDGADDFGSKGLSAISGVSTAALWTGAATEEDYDQIMRAIDREGDLPISFAKIRSRSVEGVISRMARMVRVNGARVIFVDYLQAIRHRDVGSTTRERVNDTLSTLMAAAAQLECTLVLCSQLRRAEGSKYHEPHDGELKESGDIENSAQCVVLLWRETDDPKDARYGIVYGKVAKVKRAAAGTRFHMRLQNGMLIEQHGKPPDGGGKGYALR